MSLPVLLFFSFVSTLALPIHGTFLLPIQKDHTTHHYITTVDTKTPLQPTNLLLDLEASFTWMDCLKNYNSTTYQHYYCGSQGFCSSLYACTYYCQNITLPSPACDNNTCEFFLHNPLTHQLGFGSALSDVLALPITNGSTQGPLTILRNHTFSCSPVFQHDLFLRGLPKGVVGAAALGWFDLSLQGELTAAFSLPSCFALCLSGARKGKGVGFIGSRGPYNFLPGIDISKSLPYTPIFKNPAWTRSSVLANGQPSEYFVGLTSIKINDKAVPLNQSLLVIDASSGSGGTKLSTVVSYTSMQSSIYKDFTDAFAKEASAMNLTSLTKPVKPFRLCYDERGMASTRVGPAVPTIDLVFQSKDVYWRIFGANSMVRVKSKGGFAWCLGFVDGGVKQQASIIIGGYQMEDNLLQFDLQSKTLGFSSTLLFKQTTCANFNF
ncbi:hypothetical protein Tsubulata_026285 [Turnera subulata]|uniref:Peptidase A1 domain-containing protein n=1 Tax=Turnera subulata TaxID=218843 RepID=A0A9Q0FQG5_9ROSI|nr:hypothetical protein Tsubulata_026285 [Turnera subulata]